MVVRIKVDRKGKVVEAQPGYSNPEERLFTTLNNKTVWEAAKKAALQAQFNEKSDAPEFQYGTIKYIFEIKSK